MNALRYMNRLRLTAMLAAGLLFLASGCLRGRVPSNDTGLGEATATSPQPKSQFRRQMDSLRQAGLDDRSREIESSLGVNDEPTRLFQR